VITRIVVIVAVGAVGAAAPDDGLVGSWDFDEGSGDILHDRSGHGNDGQIHGATWVACGNGHALRFDGENDHVNCGNSPSLDITGPITVQAWAQPTAANRGEPGICGKFFESYALTYYGNVFWYISSGGNKADGPLAMNVWTHVAGSFDGSTLRMYINGEEMLAVDSKFKEVRHGKNFMIGCVTPDPGSGPTPRETRGFFPGLIDGVRVHNRALAPDEILFYYNREAGQKGVKPLDVSGANRLLLETFFYPDRDRVVVSVNFRWALPLADGAKVAAQLASGGAVAMSKDLDLKAARFEDEAEFSLAGFQPGACDARAVLVKPDGTKSAVCVPFQYPFDPRPVLPSPADRVVPPLPPAAVPPPYEMATAEGGGILVNVKGQRYRIESSYSYPDGGENRLIAGFPDSRGEAAWKVRTSKEDANRYRVRAEGGYYTIDRQVERTPTRVLVRDTIRNTSADIVGIVLGNHINTTGMNDPKVTLMRNPTVFVATEGGGGVGLIALDDRYQIRQRTSYAENFAGIRDEHFGLEKGASYTLEWAIYPTDSADYYDFINQVRRDEGINGRVEGAFAFVDRRAPPSKELIELKNLKYASIGCLGFPPDDPAVSLEGWEFVEYPKESAELKKTMTETKRLHPGIKVMFHVAHALYATNRPAELFGDSRALDAGGRQFHYGPDSIDYYGNYFSKQRFEEGWRWWLFYPTPENRFGPAMLRAARYMVDELGATGMWADGFIDGYIPGDYSYDRGDGCSVTIDPATKRVTRAKTCVRHAALPILTKVVQIIGEKGGVTITNGEPGSRAFWNLPMIASCETSSGDAVPISALHLGRTVTPLGNPGAIRSQRDIYRDILSKLEYGALYFWYGDNDIMKHKTLVEHMYPITFESIHAGTVRGRERIVTKRSGVYGWPGDRSLHAVYRYDARGELARNGFMTTVDEADARTELRLGESESAAVVRLPITVGSGAPINVRIAEYGAAGIRFSLHGRGPVNLRVADGQFAVRAGEAYRVTAGTTSFSAKADAQGLLITVDLDGPTDVAIVGAAGPGERPAAE
jgi:hypothetical protein